MFNVAVSGFFVGLIYGLLGVGLVILYRGSRVVNFAYGETGMVGAMVFAELRFGAANGLGALGASSAVDHGNLIALPVGVLVGAAVGAITELVVVRPLRAAPRQQVLVGTLAVDALLLAIAADRWGTAERFIQPLVAGSGIRLGSIFVSPEQLLILATAVIVLAGLGAMYRWTPFGLRMRAIALDPYAAGLLGVNVNATSVATWALAGGLAGLSAILIAPLGAFTILFMVPYTVYGLAAFLLGGLTSITGVVVAGVALGVGQAVIAYETPIPGITDVAVACLVLIVLVLRRSTPVWSTA